MKIYHSYMQKHASHAAACFLIYRLFNAKIIIYMYMLDLDITLGVSFHKTCCHI